MLVGWSVKRLKAKLFRGSGVDCKFTNLMKLKGNRCMFCLSFLRDKGIYEFISAARLINKRGIKARFC